MLDQAHIHLLITHLPVFGSILGALVLVHGLYTESRPTRVAAYNVLVLSAVGALIANFTGEGAEHTVEGLPGVYESIIEEHEESAIYVVWILSACGLLSLAATFASIRDLAIERKLSLFVLVLSLAGFAATARTAFLGGQIRHTEIRSGATAPMENTSEKEKEEMKEDEDD